VKKLLHRLNFSFKKPKLIPGKFDNHLQDLFLRKYRRILKTKGKNDVVLFADAMHPTHQMAASYGWIKLHFLPPYSPNLNLIERLWKFFNEKVRNNRYYATFPKFTEACKSFFRCRKKWTEELRTRITENFHRFKTNVLSN
jgi:transposase